MTGPGVVGWSATLSDTRAWAAIDARRYGVPPTMIETATRRRSVGDWRGACAAADVDLFFDPDSLRRRHGRAAAEALLADLRTLAPDLLRWHMPRRGHDAGQLLEGLLIPLAEYDGAGTTLTLAAATPQFALAAGQRIVLAVLERGARTNPAMRALHEAVHPRSAERYDLRRHRMFWDAACAPHLRDLCATDVGNAADITRLQDKGRAVAAWSAAGFELTLGAPSTTSEEQQRLTRWLATIPVNLPRLADRVRDALPGADNAVIRCAGGAIILSGFEHEDGRPRAMVVPPRAIRGLRTSTPTVPDAAWSRPPDVDLLRLGLLEPHELHPLVASALAQGSDKPAAFREWRYSTPSGIEAQYADLALTGSGSGELPAVLVRCGTDLHRVARVEGRWLSVDHDEHAARELLLARLGGPTNPCRTAARYLGGGRHVIELVANLLEHGRVTEATRLLRDYADTDTALADCALPDGTTVGQALDLLRENTLRLRMTRAGAPPVRDSRSTRIPPHRSRTGRPRKGEPARLETSR
jgi:hypothetical protein